MKRATAWIFAAAFVVAAAGCGQGNETANTDTPDIDLGSPTPESDEASVGTSGDPIAIADIVAQPAEYMGDTVTVEADVEEVFGPRAFALDEDAPVRGGIDNDMLVFARNAGNLADIDDQWLNNRVRVTGTVGRLSVVEVEREIGWDLDPAIEVELERSGAVLIAQSIERVGGATNNNGTSNER